MKRYQVHDEESEIDDEREIDANSPGFAAEEWARRGIESWAPGDGDSCECFVQESGKPETRQRWRVHASFRMELGARLVRK